MADQTAVTGAATTDSAPTDFGRASEPTTTLERQLLRDMLRIRRLEEKAAERYSAGKIRGFLHLYIGEEAIAVGAIPLLQPDDAIVSTYREHGHALIRGISAGAIMAEMYGKANGCSRGRGGSMHLFDASRRFYGGNAIVTGGLPVAVGLALADKLQDRPRVTVCIFGDGAVAEGEFHEALNLAALWRLPVLFLCENNQYAMGTALERHQSMTDIAAKGAAYGMTAAAVDGMDVLAVRDAARRAIDHVRAGSPYLLEARTYRFRAHSMYDAELYRGKDEVEHWKKQDPILTLTEQLRQHDGLSDADLAAIESDIAKEIDSAVEFAEAGPWEPVADLLKDVLTDPGETAVRTTRSTPSASDSSTPATPLRSTYREAVRAALHEALTTNPQVFLMGEDIGRYGGPYACSKGFLDEFGPERIRDAPLSESTFAGAGIGAALGGMRPIVEIMTVNFSLLALDQIVNNAATLRHMSGGQFSVPVIVRMATGGGRQLAAQHSHSLEVWYAHVPGIKVVAPATVTDARYMLQLALQESDPVIIFEHLLLYPQEGELELPPDNLFQAAVRRQGRDVSLITYGGSLGKCLAAAEQLAAEDIDAEVIDLRSLRPLDMDTILTSISKTHRGVVVDEGWRTGSLAAEIVAQVHERAFYDLDAPVARVCSQETPIPYAQHLEEAALPRTEQIVTTVREMLQRHE